VFNKIGNTTTATYGEEVYYRLIAATGSVIVNTSKGSIGLTAQEVFNPTD
jgi:hypothetical protein